MTNNEDKNYTLNEFLRHLSHIQDTEYQKRIWIRNEGPECQGFDDAVCDFFDIGDPILDDYQNYGITDKQYKVLKKLHDEFRKFSDDNDFPEEFIDTPEWAKIMELAKDVLRAFNYSKTES
jgi:hypothetical protein